jgi:hypothetical protein
MKAKNNDVSCQVLRERNAGVGREKKRKRGEERKVTVVSVGER